MTTTIAPNPTNAANLPTEMVSLLGSAVMGRVDPTVPPVQQWANRPATTDRVPRQPQWLQPTIWRMLALPWNDDDWLSDANPIQPDAAADMLVLLAIILPDAAPPPIIVPTWRGGVQAEWHTNNVDLEIEVDPTEPAQYFFSGPTDDEEYEEPVAGNMEQLVGLVGRLSPGTGCAGGGL